MLFIHRKPPHPTYENVEPAGAGWYRWQRGRWRRYDVNGYNPEAKWLSANKLKELELDAVITARIRRSK